MTLPYEEAAKVWASRRFGLPVEAFVRVEFETDIDGYDTSGWWGIVVAEVVLVNGERRREELDRDVGVLIAEVLAIAAEEPG